MRSTHNWASDMKPDLKLQLLQSFGVSMDKLKELGIVTKDSSGHSTTNGRPLEPLALTAFSRNGMVPPPGAYDRDFMPQKKPAPPVTPPPKVAVSSPWAVPVGNFQLSGKPKDISSGMEYNSWMIPYGSNSNNGVNAVASASRHQFAPSTTPAAIIPQGQADLPAELKRLQSMIQQLYTMCDGWISKNAGQCHAVRDPEILVENPILTTYLCRLTYPRNKQHALSHISTLMSDKMGRDNLLLRMFTEFFVNRIWPVTEWLDYDGGEMGARLKSVFGRLHHGGG